jgi:hypothetical protein
MTTMDRPGLERWSAVLVLCAGVLLIDTRDLGDTPIYLLHDEVGT